MFNHFSQNKNDLDDAVVKIGESFAAGSAVPSIK
jgi:hypothetical protein